MEKNEKDNNGQYRKRMPGVKVGAAALGVLLLGLCGAAYWLLTGRYDGEDVRVYVPTGTTAATVGDSLRSTLGDVFGGKVYGIWSGLNSDAGTAEGSYVITRGMSAMDVARKLKRGAQDPVRVTFNNVRTLDQLAERVARRLELSPEAFVSACDTVLAAKGYTVAEYPAAFLPDTYEFYWNASPASVVTSLVGYTDRFWNDERRARAKALGLTPVEVATLASIVEEETAKGDERPMVARLYLNRLRSGMMLQADPTVKYAVGDFGLRRILAEHLRVESPYNTYKHAGLPPGPIRVPERQTLQAVLDAPRHDYLYMCAREDFSGYHNFARTLAEHQANARRYHQALDRRNIKR